MGKKQHQKDKIYITNKEWSTLFGGAKQSSRQSEFRRLPYDFCALSFVQAEHPYVTPKGTIYDLTQIIPYLKKYKHCPVSGDALDSKSLFKVTFHKNSEGKNHCPITYKVFTEHSHIVVITTTGNCYSYDAVDQLIIKPKLFKDLLTDEPFQSSNILTIQDPKSLDKFNICDFYHLKNNHNWSNKSESSSSTSNIRYITPETKAALEEVYQKFKPNNDSNSKNISQVEVEKQDLTARNAAHYSTGAAAASFTSTILAPETSQAPAILDKDTVIYRLVKKKAYVRLVTNYGNLNLELHSDIVQKTCDNFINLCKSNYYDKSYFHRSILHFMVQGGDPTGTGAGGQSCWGEPFNDEFKPNLTHSERGVLSMANTGPNSNNSQFFITYRSCRYLDNKHTVFGKLVGGLDILSNIEDIHTDEHDRPVEDVIIERTIVFVDPFKEAEEFLEEEKSNYNRISTVTPSRCLPPASAVTTTNVTNATSDVTSTLSSANKILSSMITREAGVGKYIDKTKLAALSDEAPESEVVETKKRKKATDSNAITATHKKVRVSSFNDFSSW